MCQTVAIYVSGKWQNRNSVASVTKTRNLVSSYQIFTPKCSSVLGQSSISKAGPVPGPFQKIQKKRPDLTQTLFDLKKDSKCPSTWKNYSSAFARFDQWCANHDLASIPAHTDTILYFLADLAESSHSVAAVQTACAAIGAFHTQQGFCSPCRAPDLKPLLTGIKNRYGKPPIQRHLLTKNQYRQFLQLCLGPSLSMGTLYDFRTAWTELIILHTSARWGDLRRLTIRNFKISTEKMQISFPKRKNDQQGQGHTIIVKLRDSQFCPVKITKRYFSLLDHVAKRTYQGYVVPTIIGVGANMTVRENSPASYKSCRDKQKAVLAQMNLNASQFGLHSGRISSSVLLKDAGFAQSDIAARIGWSYNSRMPQHYTKNAKTITDSMDASLAL